MTLNMETNSRPESLLLYTVLLRETHFMTFIDFFSGQRQVTYVAALWLSLNIKIFG